MRELEVFGAEVFPVADNAVGFRAADLQIAGAEGPPIRRALKIMPFRPHS